MKPFNLEKVRDNKPFEVFFYHVGWVEGKLLHVSIISSNTILDIGFEHPSLVHKSETFDINSDRLRMKEVTETWE